MLLLWYGRYPFVCGGLMLRVIFGLPWPVMALIAAGFFWLAQNSREWVAEHEAEKAQALEQGVPAPVPLDAFTAEDVGLVDEVHVTAWINPEHNYELTKQRKGTDTVRRMFVLFGPGDGPDSTVARGVVVLHPGSVDAFIELVTTQVADPFDPRLLFNLNGARESSPDLSTMVNDALTERGLTKDADFLVVEPYLEGRDAALAPDPEAADRNFQMIGGAGVVAALLALFKFLAARRSRARRKEAVDRAMASMPVPPPVAQPMPAPPATGVEPPVAAGEGARYATLATPATGVWSPLEAVKAKQMAQSGPVSSRQVWEPKPPSDGRADGRAEGLAGGLRFGLGRGVAMIRALGLGVVAYGVLFMMFGMANSPLSLNKLLPNGGFGISEMQGMQTAMPDGPEMAAVSEPAAVPEPVVVPEAAPSVTAEVGATVTAEVPMVAVAEDPVEMPDVAMAQMAWLDDLRAQIYWALAGAGLLILAAGGLALARRAPRRVEADPYDRLSQRLR